LRSIQAVALAVVIAIAPLAAQAQPPSPGDAALLGKFRQRYYNLPRAGFVSATCKVVPDWSVMLGMPRTDPKGAAAYAILDQLHFTATIDAHGGVKTDKQNGATGLNAQQQAGIQQIFAGMDQTLTGFVQTWQLFVISAPTPSPSQPGVKLTPTAGGYRITYREAPATDVSVDTDREGKVSHLAVKSEEFNSTIDAQFEPTPEGLLLNHYVGHYVASEPGANTDLVVDIAYQTVGGVRLPSQLGVQGKNGASPFKATFAFTGCQVTRKTP